MKQAIDTFLAASTQLSAMGEVRRTVGRVATTLDYLAEIGEDGTVFQNPKAAQKAIREMQKLIAQVK